ncbi:glycosyl transferase family 2 [Roseiarcus fermentans]|uniref:Glycosyl transferase family 2 n=1 Tax=Roseiarcus fermentans TaxID=1473586 RepID=A0A366FQV4_9HYPH|nr:glycosyltransferase family 2 protein [Roseiarcus fermentans]RBP16099.1 glycosyl transferase family 2 [Roseiarcus fermentans]
MNADPRCSVIIPTYNTLDLLPHAVASVRMQGVEDIEILVIDDASTDGTAEWLAAEASRDPRVVPLHSERRGPSHTRNLAIFQARAPIVAFLDADDAWWPMKLERALAFHEGRPDVAFSFTDYLHVGPHGDVRRTCFDYWRPPYVDRETSDFKVVTDAELELLAVNVVGTSTVVASRQALQNANGFAAASRSAEDWELWLRLAARGPVACSSATTTTYLMRPTSVTSNKDARIAAMRAIVEPYSNRTDKRARQALRQATARIDTAEGEQARALGDYWGAARAHLRSFMRWPMPRTARAAASDLLAACTKAA